MKLKVRMGRLWECWNIRRIWVSVSIGRDWGYLDNVFNKKRDWEIFGISVDTPPLLIFGQHSSGISAGSLGYHYWEVPLLVIVTIDGFKLT